MKKMMLAVAAVAAVLGARAADALPEGYEQVEYIRSTGVQWINTEYVPNDTDRIEAKVSFPVLEANMCLWCSRGAATLTNSLSAFVMKSSDVFNPRVDCNDNLAKATGIQLTTTGDYLIVGDGKTRTAYVNDAEFSIAAAEFTPVNPLTLFASYGKDDVSALATADMANWGRYILYFFKVTDKDGNVQVDMVPCRNAEGVHGLYDLRRAKFYPSEGRAAFVGVSDPQPVDILSARNYVQDGLVAQWDAIENAGLGLHDNGAATWVDISSAKKGGDFAVSGGGFLDNALRLGLVSSGAYVTKKMNLTAMTIEVVLMRTSGTTSIHRFTVPLADTSDGKYDTTFESWSNDDEALLERIGATRLLGAKPANNKRTTFATRYDVGGYHLFQTTVSGTTTLATGKASDTFEQTNHREIPSRLEFFTGNQNVDVYAVRIYNRRLTDEELTRNRHIDNDRFDSSLPAGVPSNNGALVSDGRQIFETDYHMDKDSRFEIEFAFTTVEAQARICGNDAIEGEFRTSLYANGNKNFAISGGDGFDGRTFGVAGDTKRHTGIFDGPTKKCILVTGTTTKSVDCNQDVTKTATYPLTLFSRWATTDCTSINDTAKARIYACRLYKKINGAYVLQRDYVPCVSNRVAGFYERVHGTFSTGKTLKPFAWTGDVMRIGDAPYIETEGNASQVLNTKYRVGPNTRVTCDFALNQVISYERIFGLERAAVVF